MAGEGEEQRSVFKFSCCVRAGIDFRSHFMERLRECVQLLNGTSATPDNIDVEPGSSGNFFGPKQSRGKEIKRKIDG